jgi:hypothetical protein
MPTKVLQMRFATDQKSWWRGQWAASASVLIFILAPVSLATAQQAVMRDLCASAAWISAPPTAAAIAPTPALNAVEPNPRSVPPTPAAPDSAEPDVESISVESIPAPIAVDPTEIAKIVPCVHASPIGVRYNPELTAKVRRQYEDKLIYANDATKEKVISNVFLNARIDITTPPPSSYYRDDGPTFISLTGGITNDNPFPLSSVSIRCDYRDARDVPQSFEFPFRYTLAAGGYIPYQDKIINALPPRSVVNEISCKVETAEIWQNTDVIQYLNAPLNPDVRPSSDTNQQSLRGGSQTVRRKQSSPNNVRWR